MFGKCVRVAQQQEDFGKRPHRLSDNRAYGMCPGQGGMAQWEDPPLGETIAGLLLWLRHTDTFSE